MSPSSLARIARKRQKRKANYLPAGLCKQGWTLVDDCINSTTLAPRCHRSRADDLQISLMGSNVDRKEMGAEIGFSKRSTQEEHGFKATTQP